MKKFNRINWQGGMKVSPEHFIQTENYHIEQMGDLRRQVVGRFGFGLLPIAEVGLQAGIQIQEHVTNQVEVKLNHCNAITASGERISYQVGADNIPLSKRFSPQTEENSNGKSTGHWQVILGFDPYERTPIGELDPAENPPRHPHCEGTLKLHIVSSAETDLSRYASHFITIGKIRKEGQRYVVDNNYIPPCCTMSAHEELKGYESTFNRLLLNINTSSKEIIAKVHNRAQGSNLANDIQELSRLSLSYISSIYFRLSNYGVHQHPIDCAEQLSTLASTLYVGLLSLPSVRKDELLKYFYEWSGVAPGSLEELLISTMELKYDHRDIRSVMVKLEHFIKVIEELWDKLSRLEYIGQRKESLVVSASGGQQREEERRGFFVSE